MDLYSGKVYSLYIRVIGIEKLNAMIGLVTVFVVLTFMIPMTQELLPIITADSGATTGFMVSSIILIIIVGGLYVFIKQSMGDEQHANIQGS